MPKYNYKCKECEIIFEAFHSMNERLTDCKQCNTIESLVKIPNQIAVQFRDSEVGKIVDSYIEEAREELGRQKEKLQEQDWNSD